MGQHRESQANHLSRCFFLVSISGRPENLPRRAEQAGQVVETAQGSSGSLLDTILSFFYNETLRRIKDDHD